MMFGARASRAAAAAAVLWAAALAGACDGEGPGALDGYDAPPGQGDALGKRFKDDEFLCTPPAARLQGGDAPTYAAQIEPLLAGKCVACHKAGGTSPDLSTYALAKDEALASEQRIKAGTMPPTGALADADKALFSAWVAGGMLEGSAGGTDGAADADADADHDHDHDDHAPADSGLCQKHAAPAPAPAPAPADEGGGQTVVAYQGDGGAKALIDAKCIACHKPGGTSPDLTTFAAASAAGGESQEHVAEGSMPPGGGLSAAEKALFAAWAAGGFLETSN